MKVNVIGGSISQEEINAYVDYGRKKYHNRPIEEMTVKLDGEFVDLAYKLAPVPFSRIRRITGYLVGDLGRFNNAKRKEVEDRVNHTVS